MSAAIAVRNLADGETYATKPIPDFPGYYATDDGRIWNANCRIDRRGSVLKPWLDKYGRPYVKLRNRNGRRYNLSVAHAVLLAFVGPRPPGTECCHRDDDRLNNAVANLRWDTRAANQEDRLKNGRSGTAIIDAATAAAVKRLYACGLKRHEIRDKLGISSQIVSQIIHGRSWAYVQAEV